MRVDWQTIPHKEQRYNTSGDWYWDGPVLNIRISQLSNAKYEFCLGLHELIEAMLCHFAGIEQSTVDGFDMPYEYAHAIGDATYPCGCAREPTSNPGGDRHAPYRKQHEIADAAERVVAYFLGIFWADYDAEVDRPPQ